MLPHIKIYDSYFGYSLGERVCEITGKYGCDIHHIDARGLGGRKSMDKIENLMALTRRCHDFFGDKSHWKEFLTEVHEHFLKTQTPWAVNHPTDRRIFLVYGKRYDYDW